MRRSVFWGLASVVFVALAAFAVRMAVASPIDPQLRASVTATVQQVVMTAELLRIRQAMGEIDDAERERVMRLVIERLRTARADDLGPLRMQRDQAVERLLNHARARLAAPTWPRDRPADSYRTQANAQLQAAFNLWPTVRARGADVAVFLVPVVEVIGWTHGRTDGARVFESIDAEVERVLVFTASPSAAATMSAGTTVRTATPLLSTPGTLAGGVATVPQQPAAAATNRECWNLPGWWYVQGILHVFEPNGTWYAGDSRSPMVRGTWRALDAAGQAYELRTDTYMYRATLLAGGSEISLNWSPQEGRGARFSPCGGGGLQVSPQPGSTAGGQQGQQPVPMPPPVPPTLTLTQGPGQPTTAPMSLGCFADDGSRDLPNEPIATATMTIESCIAHCAGKGYAYAAVQYGSHCFCGNTYGRQGALPRTRCEETRCSGNPGQWCGGSWSNAVYAAARVATPSSPPPGTAQTGTYDYDIDRPGGDYRNFELPAADPQLCAARCAAESACRAWTYVKPGVQGRLPRCWLKNTVPPPVRGATFAVSGVKPTATAAPGTVTIANPSLRGYRLDYCLLWAQQCGEPAATAWCRAQGYQRATHWQPERAKPTLVIGDGKVCNEEGCHGFASVTCAADGAAPVPALPAAPPQPTPQPTAAACPSITGVWYWQGSQVGAHFLVDVPGPVGTWQYGGGEVVRDWPDHADRWGTWQCSANIYVFTRRNGTVYTQVTLRADGKFYAADGAQATKGQ